MEFSHSRTIRQSMEEYGRGVAGGLMFSLPMLCTMEVWWAGVTMPPLRMLGYVGFTFALLLAYNRFVGLRKDAAWVEVVIDSIEELGIGILTAMVSLFLFGQISFEMSRFEVLGKVVAAAMMVAIGVSVGTAQLGADDDGDSGTDDDNPDDSGECLVDTKAYLPQTGIALCGAVLFAANVAPTEEGRVIAMETHPLHLLMVVFGSLLLTALVLHFAGFRGADIHVSGDSLLSKIRGIITTYATALTASACLLWFFGIIDDTPVHVVVGQIVVIAVPATLGASAGRLLLQTVSPK